MIRKVLSFVLETKLFSTSSGIIVTVSGGIDSMVLLHLLNILQFRIGVAHCNFGLRGEESDLDEEFVKTISDQMRIPFFLKRFDTVSFAKEKRVSTQEAARELRYRWFDDLIVNEGFDCYATAHNFDDRIETFLINAMRGSGVTGLRSIQPKHGKCVRPILFAPRTEIESYAKENGIIFREDSSNFKDDYTRNKIRHHLIPAFEAIDPHFRKGFGSTLSALSDSENFVNFEIEKIRKLLLIENGKTIRIPIDKIVEMPTSRFILWELLKPFGFNRSIVENILGSIALDNSTGKRFMSSAYILIIDRDNLLIQPIEPIEKSKGFLIDLNTEEISNPIEIRFKESIVSKDFEIEKNESVAQIDYDKLNFPLKLRKYKNGDFFYPIGMKGKKRLSDFFCDKKLSYFDKQNIWILESEGKIVWIVGQRMDDRFRISLETKRVFTCQLI